MSLRGDQPNKKPPPPPRRRKGDPGILAGETKDARAAARAAIAKATKKSDAKGLDDNEPDGNDNEPGANKPGYRLKRKTMRDNRRRRSVSSSSAERERKDKAFPSRLFDKLTGRKDKKGTDSVASSDVVDSERRGRRGRSPDRPAREGNKETGINYQRRDDKHKRPYSPGPHTRRDRYPEPGETPLGTNRARSSDEEGRIPLRRSPNNNGRHEEIFPDSIPDLDADFQIPGPVEDRPPQILQPRDLTGYSLKQLISLQSYIEMNRPCKGCGESITPCLSCHRGWTWVQLASERLGRTVQSEEDLRCTECLQMVAMCEICNLPLSKVKVMRRHRSMKETNVKEYPLRR